MFDMFEEMKKFQKELNKTFSSFWEIHDVTALPPSPFRKPLVDLRETEKELIATFELPGVERSDIKIDVKEESIEVRVEKKMDVSTVKEDRHISERSYTGFYRFLTLPHPIIASNIKATYRDGVLELVMPKGQKKEKPQIQIE